MKLMRNAVLVARNNCIDEKQERLQFASIFIPESGVSRTLSNIYDIAFLRK